jgi:hypothetical protein
VVCSHKTRERKSVSEKIIKEGEIGELLVKVGQVPLEKTFYLKIIKVQRETILFPGYIFMQTSSLGELKYYLKVLYGKQDFN